MAKLDKTKALQFGMFYLQETGRDQYSVFTDGGEEIGWITRYVSQATGTIWYTPQYTDGTKGGAVANIHNAMTAVTRLYA